METKKPIKILITQICAKSGFLGDDNYEGSSGHVLGLGSDQKVYYWEYSLADWFLYSKN